MTRNSQLEPERKIAYDVLKAFHLLAQETNMGCLLFFPQRGFVMGPIRIGTVGTFPTARPEVFGKNLIPAVRVSVARSSGRL